MFTESHQGFGLSVLFQTELGTVSGLATAQPYHTFMLSNIFLFKYILLKSNSQNKMCPLNAQLIFANICIHINTTTTQDLVTPGSSGPLQSVFPHVTNSPLYITRDYFP